MLMCANLTLLLVVCELVEESCLVFDDRQLLCLNA